MKIYEGGIVYASPFFRAIFYKNHCNVLNYLVSYRM